LLKVMVPLLAPAFLTSSLFAFLASMDNYPISIASLFSQDSSESPTI
jgi:ABC-type spermidine/putrescine transport system permease subunit II